MKKIYLLLVLCLCLCGCSNSWEKKIQVSTLKYEDDYIVGKAKNLTDKAYDVIIKFKLKSGSLVEESACQRRIKPNETIDLNCPAPEIDDTYSVEIDDIELTEFEIPKLKEGIIDVDTFKYHFQEIYDMHTLNFVVFSLDFEDIAFPYADEITYEDNIISIKSDFKDVITYSKYDIDTNKLDTIFGFVNYQGNNEFLNKIITNISLMKSISNSSSTSLNVTKALLNTDIEEGRCWVVDNWCITPKKDNVFYEFYISEKM